MFRLAFFCDGIQESFLFDSNYANRIIVKTGMKFCVTLDSKILMYDSTLRFSHLRKP